MNKRLIITLITIIGFILITTIIIALGRGYRFNPKTKSFQSTGLLVSSSFPTGSQVFVDDHLVSATNSTIPLPPGTYNVKITKDGYIPWSKKLTIKGEVVTKADALLLPVAPELRPLTTTGALNPSLSSDGIKISYGVATSSAEKQGIWILDLSDRPLSFQSTARQIVKDNEFIKYSQGKTYWSPDGKQILIQTEQNYYLLNTDVMNDNPEDTSLTIEFLIQSWIKEKTDKEEALFKTLKPKFQESIKESIKILSYSPDETKILYEATASAIIPEIITPPLIGTNSQPEERSIKEGNIYIYDAKEDKNFQIKQGEKQKEANPEDKNIVLDYLNSLKTPEIQWLPDSQHIILVENKKINIVEYDGTNKSTLISAPFEDNFVFPFPNVTRLVILTTLNPSLTTPNLYSLSLR